MPFHSASRITDHAHRGLAAFAVQAVDEQHAVEVVGLMLQATGQVAGAHDLDRVAAHREDRPAARPPDAAPVAVVARLFPLLEPGAGPG